MTPRRRRSPRPAPPTPAHSNAAKPAGCDHVYEDVRFRLLETDDVLVLTSWLVGSTTAPYWVAIQCPAWTQPAT
jgi:hypothetical protein